MCGLLELNMLCDCVTKSAACKYEITLRDVGPEEQSIPCVGECAGATQGVFRHLRALSPARAVACAAWPIAARVGQKRSPRRNLKASSLGLPSPRSHKEDLAESMQRSQVIKVYRGKQDPGVGTAEHAGGLALIHRRLQLPRISPGSPLFG